MRSRHFVDLYAACLICSFGAFVPFVLLVPFALDLGFARSSIVRCFEEQSLVERRRHGRGYAAFARSAG